MLLYTTFVRLIFDKLYGPPTKTLFAFDAIKTNSYEKRMYPKNYSKILMILNIESTYNIESTFKLACQCLF